MDFIKFSGAKSKTSESCIWNKSTKSLSITQTPEKPRSLQPRSVARGLPAAQLRRAPYLMGDAPAKGAGRHGGTIGGKSAPPLDPTAPPAEGRPPFRERRRLGLSPTAHAPRVSAGWCRPSSWCSPSVSAGLVRWARAPSPRWGREEWRCFPAGRAPAAEGNVRAEGGWGEPGCSAAASGLVLPVVGRWSHSAFLSCFPLSCEVQREPSVPCRYCCRERTELLPNQARF